MTTKQQDYNDGQRDGSRASVFDQIVQNFNPLTSSDYNKGFENGAANQPKDNDGGSSTSGSSSGSSSDSSSSKSGCFLSSACAQALDLRDDCKELTTLRSFRDEGRWGQVL